MFDNTCPNIIILTDHTDPVYMQRPYGPAKVAHELRKAGYQVFVLNHLHIFSINELFYILKQLISKQTIYLGISSLFYRDLENSIIAADNGIQYSMCKPGTMLPHGHGYNKDLKQLVKDINPDCKLVLGGPNATDVRWNRDYDYVVCGYADLSSINLANHLLNGEQLRKAHKSIYGFTVINDSKADGFDMTNSTMRYEPHDIVLPGETLPAEIARGCIFDCAFCSFPLNGKKKLDFIRSQEIIYNEFLENYEKYQVTRYIFSDDTFNDSLEKIQMIYNVSKRLPFKLEFWAWIRLDLMAAHKETIDLLFGAGLRGCYMGIETWHKPTGEIIGKGLAKEKQLAAMKYIKSKWGDEVMLHGSFIVGLPEESIESVNDTFNILMSDECSLDSWDWWPFNLENKEMRTSQFTSRIGKDPESFGYRIIGKKDHLLLWENDYMNSNIAIEHANKFSQLEYEKKKLKLNGWGSFGVANLGYDLSYTMNKPVVDINWSKITLAKKLRSAEYKKKLYNILNIVPYLKTATR